MSHRSVPTISEDEEKSILKDAMIVFDTSALCRFYNLTPDAKSNLIGILEEDSGRIWLPYRVLLEFDRHKDEERKKPLAQYGVPKFLTSNHFGSEFLDYINKLKNEKHRHPFVKENTLSKWQKFQEEYLQLMEKIRVSIQNELNEQKSEIIDQLKNDTVDDFISSLDSGSDFSWDDMKEIVKEGTWRYSNKIPPGYMDEIEKTSIDRFGDLIIWKELISEALKRQKDVILITQDLKEDWNSLVSSESIVPREELLKEFTDSTGQRIWMYTIADFIRKKAFFSGLTEDDNLSKLLLELNLSAISDDCIKAECPECDKVFGITSDDIYWDWDTESLDDREMGIELCHTNNCEIECPKCGNTYPLTFNAYEYPVGSINYVEIEADDLDILYTPDLDDFVEDIPSGSYESCVRCGEWTNDLDESGLCSECRDEFERMIRED